MWGFTGLSLPENLQKRLWISEQAECIFMEELQELLFWGALFCRIRKISFGKMADITSMGFLTVQIIAVWGNFFNREAFGEYTDSLFAMLIPKDVLDASVVTELMSAHVINDGEISCIQVHPLFLYKSLWYLLLFFILLFYTWKKKFDGEIFLRYLAGCFLGGAGIEWLRPRRFVIPGTEVPALLPVYILLFVAFITTAAVRRSLSKREKYIKYEEKRKGNGQPFSMKTFTALRM